MRRGGRKHDRVPVRGRARDRQAADAAAPPAGPVLEGAARTVAMVLFSIIVAASAVVFGALAVHLVPVLEATGLATATAVFIASLKGAAQVAGRIWDLTLARRWHPIDVGRVSVAFMPLSFLVLMLGGASYSAALTFIVLFLSLRALLTRRRLTETEHVVNALATLQDMLLWDLDVNEKRKAEEHLRQCDPKDVRVALIQSLLARAATVPAPPAGIYTRVRHRNVETDDIHDRVNLACRKSYLTSDADRRTITLELEIDPTIAPLMEYFRIFSPRMDMCYRAAKVLDARFQLRINGQEFYNL